MELDDLQDYLEPEVAIMVALVAAGFSPQARKLVRRSAVYGLSRLLAAGDAIGGLVRSVQHNAKPAASSFVHELAQEARAERQRAQAGADPLSTSEATRHIEPAQPQP